MGMLMDSSLQGRPALSGENRLALQNMVQCDPDFMPQHECKNSVQVRTDDISNGLKKKLITWDDAMFIILPVRRFALLVVSAKSSFIQ